MKTIQTFLAALLFVITQHSRGQEIKSHQIIVYGNAEVKATANQAELNFSIKGFGSSLRIAVDNAQKQVAETTKRLFDLGLKKGNLNTSHFHSGENYSNKAFLSSKKDYQAIITTFVTVDSLDLLEPVIFALSENGVEHISSIGFSLKDDTALETSARKQAITNAKQKAEEMAKHLALELGDVIHIEELVAQTWQEIQEEYRKRNDFSIELRERLAYQQALSESFFAKTIALAAMVKMVFELKQIDAATK
ncbi:MAG: SIMPL domain-containing protein [bacterium]